MNKEEGIIEYLFVRFGVALLIISSISLYFVYPIVVLIGFIKAGALYLEGNHDAGFVALMSTVLFVVWFLFMLILRDEEKMDQGD